MPMIDLTYPAGALDEEARAEAVERLTAAVLRNEGAPDNDYTRAMCWTLVHELPAGALHVGGFPATQPIYRLIVTVPAGTLLHGPGPVGTYSRDSLVREVTEIVLEAEGTPYSPTAAARVYCIVNEVADGYWGGAGETMRIEDIVATTNEDGPRTRKADDVRGAIEEALAPRPRRGAAA
jgi:phenylpyruvate tautomerase PptA (4-oxalocrotonate tautomerase family)